MRNKKAAAFLFVVFSVFLFLSTSHAKTRRFSGSGEVKSVDPVYNRVTIKHNPIKDFAGSGETEFVLASPDLFKGIAKKDLVDFEFVDENGDIKLDKIKRTGVAPEEKKDTLGQAVQGVIEGTGEVAKAVTSPLPPAHEVTSAAVDTTTGATGSVLENADTPIRQDF